MPSGVVGLVAAVALLASGGIANAEGPVKLTDVQLDKVTAGAPQTSVNAAVNVAATAAVNYVAAVNTAVAANVAVMGGFNNMVAADTAVAIAVAGPQPIGGRDGQRERLESSGRRRAASVLRGTPKDRPPSCPASILVG